MYPEFIGISQEVSALIEAHRADPAETKSDILSRVLGPSPTPAITSIPPPTPVPAEELLDLKQGVKVSVGDTLWLFLSVESLRRNEPDGRAEVRRDGLYIEGKRVTPSRGSHIQPAMAHFQRLRTARGGKIASLNAYRQWYVRKGDQLVRLEDLKDPAQRRRRGWSNDHISLADLGLE